MAGTEAGAGGSGGHHRHVAIGVVLAFALHLLQIPLALVLGALECGSDAGDLFGCFMIGAAPLLLIGVSQLLYVGPVALVLWRKHKRGMLQGLAIGAAVTLALNASCWGLLVFGTAIGG